MLDLGGSILIDLEELYYVEKDMDSLLLKLSFKCGKEHLIAYSDEAERHTDYMMIKRYKEKLKEEEIDREINKDM